ncbi:MAG TPA: glycosyltransferase [Hyphomicrobium sp.]|nr:glycosyltransferase [Hyphomicrobium sp.]
MRVAFFGSSLLSSYWNGAATYYRGVIAALSRLGCRTTFFEPDAFGRQQHRDMDPPVWADVVVYGNDPDSLAHAWSRAQSADLIVQASGIGVFDDEILALLVKAKRAGKVCVFWDVDAPATLAQMRANPQHRLCTAVGQLDLVLTYGGGAPVVEAYESFGARRCVPVYNALDPSTHFRVAPDARFKADLAFLGNRLPDRETRVSTFLFDAARLLPERSFLLGGSGWEAWQLPNNVRGVGHVSTRDHNAFNSTPLAIINIARESMAEIGFSPATRIFEAAGAGAAIITDAWEGIEQFLQPGEEVLTAASAADVTKHLQSLTPERACEIGDAARRRILRDHTYDQRAELVFELFSELVAQEEPRVVVA